MSSQRAMLRLATVTAAFLVGTAAHAQLVDWRTLAIRGQAPAARGDQLYGFVPAVDADERGGACAVVTYLGNVSSVARAYPSFEAARLLVIVGVRGTTPVGLTEYRFERGVALPRDDDDALLEATRSDSVRAMRHMQLDVSFESNGGGLVVNDYLRQRPPGALVDPSLYTWRVAAPREVFDRSSKLGSPTARARRVVEACDVAAGSP